MKYTFSILLILIVFFNSTSGQQQPASSIKLWIEASKAEKSLDFKTAIKLYSILYNRKPMSSRIGFKLADLLKQTRQYDKAMMLYKELYELDPNKNVLALYSFGQMAMSAGKYRLALRGFQKFEDEFVANEKKKYLKKLADIYIESIQNFIDTSAVSRDNAQVEKTSISCTNHFSEIRYDPFGIKTTDHEPVMLKQNGIVNVNSPDSIPPGFLSSDNRHFYFSRRSDNASQSGSIFKIAVDCLPEIGRYAEELLLPVKNKKYTFIHPTLGTDARRGDMVLYFASDMPGGKGGFDIWYSRFNPRNNSFREPKNAGSKINTAEDEFSPYYDNQNRTLYFSSKGLTGYGGFDIYRCAGEQRNWTEPESLGFPVNSSGDDYFYHFSPKSKSYIFASNRDTWQKEGIPSDQFYIHKPASYEKISINLAFNIIENKDTWANNIKIFDSVHVKPVQTSTIELLLLEGNQEEILLTTDSVSILRHYRFEVERDKTYKINTIQHKDTSYVTFKSIADTKDSLQFIAMDIPMLKQVNLVKRVQHEVDQSKLTEKDKNSIDSTVLKVLHAFPDHSVLIHSYTDQTGSDTHNHKLSVRRARNVYNYLVSNNIDKNRLNYKGFGASNPLFPEKLPDGSDNPEGRLQNRRTEIIITFIE